MSQGFQFDESSAKASCECDQVGRAPYESRDGTTAPFARLAYETIEDSPKHWRDSRKDPDS